MADITISRPQRTGPPVANPRVLQVKTNEVVQFKTSGARGQARFPGGRSPFGADHLSVRYGVPLKVTAVFDGQQPGRNRFRFECELDDGGPNPGGPGGGGEIEVIQGR